MILNSSSGFGQEQLCLFLVTQTNNPISLPIDMKVSLFCILAALFVLRAVYVFAAVWVIAFWISSGESRHSCSDVVMLDPSPTPRSYCLDCWQAVNDICSMNVTEFKAASLFRDRLFETHSPPRNSRDPLHQGEAGSSRTSRRRKGFGAPSVSAFIALWWWGAGCWHGGDEVWVLSGGVRGVEAVASHRRAAICIIFMSCSWADILHVTSVVFTLLSRIWNRAPKRVSEVMSVGGWGDKKYFPKQL